MLGCTDCELLIDDEGWLLCVTEAWTGEDQGEKNERGSLIWGRSSESDTQGVMSAKEGDRGIGWLG